MTKPLIQIGNDIREMNKAEHDQHIADLAEWEASLAAQVANTTAREALLTRLGITADEAQLLLGA